MKFSQLLETNNLKIDQIEISGLTCDSSQVKEGYVFVCIKGERFDGHLFAHDAIKLGASVIVTERDLSLENQVIVEDTRAAFAVMSANWFGNPAKKLKLVGVTGTNGKTSVTYMLKQILESTGAKVGLVGTIQNMIGDEVLATKNTTPSSYELNSLSSLMVKAGCEYAVMEVSSHALDQKRVYNLEFDAAIFTNLTQDHLDYHKTMENYLEAKRKLFTMAKCAILNFDDEACSKFADGLECDVITYSAESDNATFTAKNISYKSDGVDYELVGYNAIARMKMSTGGKFTVYNSMAAALAAKVLGVELMASSLALRNLSGVKGRAENVPNDKGFTIIIDYAHTPDGLINILNTFKECPKNRLTVVFGCGGDRDKTKRPIMGSIAAKLADNVIVTSDNPRTENPTEIINDILVGMANTKTPYTVIENRVEAIKYAVANAKKDDIIVLAGKGHETYQILNTGTIHLDEREVVKEALEELK